MKTIDLKDEVSRAIAASWPEFQQSHPRLARVIDRDVLVESVTQQLAADPDYQRALANAAALEHGAAALVGMIRRTVREALQTIGW